MLYAILFSLIFDLILGLKGGGGWMGGRGHTTAASDDELFKAGGYVSFKGSIRSSFVISRVSTYY